jgi:predicted ferric reductase
MGKGVHSMRPPRDVSDVFMSRPARLISAILLIMLAAGILIGAALVAFQDHSAQKDIRQALKTRTDIGTAASGGWPKKTGQVLGLLAASLVFLQFVLSAKPKTLDRIFGLHRVLYFHRFLGFSLVIMASLHPMFMFAQTDASIGPFRLAIWPRLLGMLLLTGLWVGVCAARWRRFLNIEYQRWYFLHRLGMFGAIVILTLHLWNVTRDFHRGWPLYGLGVGLSIYAALFFWNVVLKPRRLQRQAYSVSKVEPVGGNSHRVELIPAKGEVFLYAPGQFAFVTFLSDLLPVERHHWTLSSTPTQAESCTLTIKCSGDFTARLSRLRSGDRAGIDGPYGHFTYLTDLRNPGRELIMIAGGIGITPMFSMLRYMAESGDGRKVTLVWSNRTEADILCGEELEEIKRKLPNFTAYHVLTRSKEMQGTGGRLNQEKLKELLSGCNREAAAFVCGPPAMMKDVCANLKDLGFRRAHIHTEKFSY